MIKISLHSELNKDLERKWLDIEKEDNLTPFQTLFFNKKYIEILKTNNQKIALIEIVNNSTTTDILPFCIKNNKFFKIVEWIGGINFDYMGPVSSNKSIFKQKNIDFKEVFNTIVKLLNNIDIIYLEKNIQFYQNNFHNSFLNYFKLIRYEKSYKCMLDSEKNFIDTKLPIKIKNDINRQIKRLTNLGNLKFIIANDNASKKIYTNKMIELKHIQYLQTGKSMFSDNKYINFYHSLSNANEQSFKAHVSIIMLDKLIISTHVGFLNKNTYFYIMPAYDNKYGRYSPGKIHLQYLIKWCEDNNIKYFDFTEGFADYKKKWSNIEDQIFLIQKAISYKGYFFIFLLLIKNKIKKINIFRLIYSKLNKYV